MSSADFVNGLLSRAVTMIAIGGAVAIGSFAAIAQETFPNKPIQVVIRTPNTAAAPTPPRA